MSADRLRVVLDTNVIVSGVMAASGHPAQIIDVWRQGRFLLLVSPEIVNEVRTVLLSPKIRGTGRVTEEQCERLLLELATTSELAMHGPELAVRSRDEKDDYVLGCAFGGRADYLVTGDQDLLVLDGEPALAGLRILTPKAFSEVITRR